MLCFAVIGQWTWSHYRSNTVRYTYLVDGGQYRMVMLRSVNGGMQVGVLTRDLASRPAGAPPFREGLWSFSRRSISIFSMDDLTIRPGHGVAWRLPGIQFQAERDAAGRQQFQFRIVTAWLLAATSILPLMALYRMRWRPPNVCRGCGYDLRATPERCPECGTIAAKPAAA